METVVEVVPSIPNLMAALRASPGVVVYTTAIHVRRTGAFRYLFRVEGGDAELDAFEEALQTDETVASVVRLDADRREREYRVEFTDCGSPGMVVYEALAAADGYLRDGVGTAEGWRLRVEFPRHANVRTFFETCRENDVRCDLRRVTVGTRDDVRDERPYGLTAAQHTLLSDAAALGYFEVPKRTSLAELAERHGISTQAVSERLRRGIGNLVDHTLDTDTEGRRQSGVRIDVEATRPVECPTAMNCTTEECPLTVDSSTTA